MVQGLSRERVEGVFTLFSSRAKTGPLARFAFEKRLRFKLMEKKRKKGKYIYTYTLIQCACAELNWSAVILIPKAFMLLRGM